jgi:glycosyltransferase involved in cell wall biosynthesis/peptidoglycan/xylan/chitin deacetylase (PgdA/CDA1 family)
MPRLSVIIPTYNRIDRLRNCLEALCRQTQSGKDFEVIVVVDGSTDGTLAMLKGLDTPFPLRILEQRNLGQPAALNRGLRATRGRYCLFLDDDIVPAPGLVSAHLSCQEQTGGVVGVGQITLGIPEDANWFVQRYSESWSSHYAQLNSGSRAPTWTDVFGGNVSAPREHLIHVGGVDGDLKAAFDVEMGYRLMSDGLRAVYLPEALGHQDERKGIRQLTRDFERAGSASVEIAKKHPATSPELLGSFHHTRMAASFLQYASLSLKLSPRALGMLLATIGKRDERGFHFLRNYCHWLGVRKAVGRGDLWERLTGGTRILMYHAFGGEGEAPARYTVSRRSFQRQMAVLRALGYDVIPLSEYLAHRHAFTLPPARSLVLTMDDGYTDFFTRALPILEGRNLPATLFVVTGAVGDANGWTDAGELAERPIGGWEELRMALSKGITVGAHTRTHPDLTGLPEDAVWEEIEGSRRVLEDELGISVETFAYPFGETSPEVEALVRRAGFTGAVGIQEGLNSVGTPLFDLRRIEVFGTDGILRFALKVLLGRTYLPRLRPRFGQRGGQSS